MCSAELQKELDDLDYEIHQEQWEKARTRLAYLQEMCPEEVGGHLMPFSKPIIIRLLPGRHR